MYGIECRPKSNLTTIAPHSASREPTLEEVQGMRAKAVQNDLSEEIFTLEVILQHLAKQDCLECDGGEVLRAELAKGGLNRLHRIQDLQKELLEL